LADGMPTWEREMVAADLEEVGGVGRGAREF
jgi:hypothetical protein